MTYVIFLSYAVFQNCELEHNCQLFKGENQENVEMHAKRWLNITVRTFINPTITDEDMLNNVFINSNLEELVNYIYKNSDVLIQYRCYTA